MLANTLHNYYTRSIIQKKNVIILVYVKIKSDIYQYLDTTVSKVSYLF